jgi:hypothetical protein
LIGQARGSNQTNEKVAANAVATLSTLEASVEIISVGMYALNLFLNTYIFLDAIFCLENM